MPLQSSRVLPMMHVEHNFIFTSSDPHHGISKQANPPYLFSGILCDLVVSCPLLIIAPVTSV